MFNKKSAEPTKKENKMIQNAVALHQSGQIDLAELEYRKILGFLPNNTVVITNLAMARLQKGDLEGGVKMIDRSLNLLPNQPNALNNKGSALRALKRFNEALKCYDLVINLLPNHAETHSNRGNALCDLKRFEEAVKSYERAISLKSNYPEAYYNRGNAFSEFGKFEDAVASYDKAIYLKPDFAQAYCNKGNCLRDGVWDEDKLEEAVKSYDMAIKINPNYMEAHYNRGNLLKDLGQLNEALESYNLAIRINPNFTQAHFNRGNILRKFGQLKEAAISYSRVAANDPRRADAYCSLGDVFKDMHLPDKAIQSYNKAIEIKPHSGEVHYLYGNLLRDIDKHEEALEKYIKAKEIDPKINFLLGFLSTVKMKLCLWDEYQEHIDELLIKTEEAFLPASPFAIFSIIDDPDLHKKVAQKYVKERYSSKNIFPKIKPYQNHKKIRIGYYSADFHNHATSYLMANLFECHDKSKFELIAFSFGPENNDEMQKRVSSSFDQFMNVGSKSDQDIVNLSRKLEIDVAIDLKGFTHNKRVEIFAERCAPIQVSYLGYPGTMGASYMDYIIADKTVIPEESQKHYSEKVVCLPGSYQVNDAKREISNKTFTREELGLPKEGFIYCCFNNNYKITPQIFDMWMRILKSVEGSVLWLFEDSLAATRNLQKEAEKRGVSSSRLIFAKRINLPEHLARQKVADLFLDTSPCNAHTTCSDALWAGLPVVTLLGKSFTARVAASLLNAIELPELVTNTKEEYEAKAIDLANNPQKLKDLKLKLEKNRLTTPLFDTESFTRNIEKAYQIMHERSQNGMIAECINVENEK